MFARFARKKYFHFDVFKREADKLKAALVQFDNVRRKS